MSPLSLSHRRHGKLIASRGWKQVATAIAGAFALTCGAAVDAAKPDFDRDILPILSDKCFFCHGPDAEHREAELRLDARDSAIESVIVPDDPDASELIARISSDDEAFRMPPPESNLALTDEEIQLLRDWIAAVA